MAFRIGLRLVQNHCVLDSIDKTIYQNLFTTIILLDSFDGTRYLVLLRKFENRRNNILAQSFGISI